MIRTYISLSCRFAGTLFITLKRFFARILLPKKRPFKTLLYISLWHLVKTVFFFPYDRHIFKVSGFSDKQTHLELSWGKLHPPLVLAVSRPGEGMCRTLLAGWLRDIWNADIKTTSIVLRGRRPTACLCMNHLHRSAGCVRCPLIVILAQWGDAHWMLRCKQNQWGFPCRRKIIIWLRRCRETG